MIYQSDLHMIFLDLKRIAEQQVVPVDLEPYVKKLNSSRRRVMLVNNILQNVQVFQYIFLLNFS